MNRPLPHFLPWLLLAASLMMLSCSEDSRVNEPDDDDSAAGDDDDDSAAGDDDDSAAAHDDNLGIRFVTFAAKLEGIPEEMSQPGAESTLISGNFQFVYWSDLDNATIVCRQHFLFEAVARFGDAQTGACDGCGGQLSIMSVRPDDETEHTDLCAPLPARIDLSFLLTANDVTVSADFRELSLVSLEQLVDADWQLSDSGMAAAEIEQSYLGAGLNAYWIAMVGSHGWLSGKAGLDEIASVWDVDAPVLPMFVAYRNPADNPAGWALDGNCFLSTLWAVRVGTALGADPVP